MNDVFNATELATFLFADDTTCLAENRNLQELINYVNSQLNKLAMWFKANKMAVNVLDTKKGVCVDPVDGGPFWGEGGRILIAGIGSAS
jgi:hypothetical protein